MGTDFVGFRSRRGFPICKTNPFLNRIVIETRAKAITISKDAVELRDCETNDFIAPATVATFIAVEKNSFVKLYTKEMRHFFDLSRDASRMVGVILRASQTFSINKSEIFLSYKKAKEIYSEINDNNNKTLSESTYKRGIRELLTREFIAEHPNGISWFYSNPNIFFNGDRVRFVKEFCKSETFKEIQKEVLKI